MELFIGIFLVFIVVLACGIYGQRRVKNVADYKTGSGKGGAIAVAGALLSTVVGGSMTVGSAEMAYMEGMFAWWMSLGSGLAIIFLGILFNKFFFRARERRGISTIPGSLIEVYGPKMSLILGVFGLIGSWLSALSQLLAFATLLRGTISIDFYSSILITGVLFLIYLYFGGILSSSLGGIIKMLLLYVFFVASSIFIISKVGGISAFWSAAEIAYGTPKWNSLFSRGIGSSLGYGLSFFFGLMCTQFYVQSILSARNPKTALRACLITGCLTIPVGLITSSIGVYVKTFIPNSTASGSFAIFLNSSFPPTIAGIFMGACLLNTLASGAGLTLGSVTNLYNDVFLYFSKKTLDGKKQLTGIRLTTLGVVTFTTLFGMFVRNALIMNTVNLSAQVRACSVFVPLVFAAFYKGRKAHEAGIWSSVIGVLTAAVWYYLKNPFGIPNLWMGLGSALIVWLILNAIFSKNYELIDLYD